MILPSRGARVCCLESTFFLAGWGSAFFSAAVPCSYDFTSLLGELGNCTVYHEILYGVLWINFWKRYRNLRYTYTLYRLILRGVIFDEIIRSFFLTMFLYIRELRYLYMKANDILFARVFLDQAGLININYSVRTCAIKSLKHDSFVFDRFLKLETSE